MFILSGGDPPPCTLSLAPASHLQRISLCSGASAAALNHRLLVDIASCVSKPGKRQSHFESSLHSEASFASLPVERVALTEGALLIATGKMRASVRYMQNT